MTAEEIIRMLLNVLPDSGGEMHDDISWDWCWSELCDEPQEEVKEARRRALDYLKGEGK